MKRSDSPEPSLRRHYLVIAYDIPDDRRRSRVARVLEDFGVRIQYSVFECHLTPAERRVLGQALIGFIDPVDDAISIYALSPGSRRRTVRLGREPPRPDPPYLIL